MGNMNLGRTFVTFFCFTIQLGFSQFEFEDAPTRRGSSQRNVGYLEGVFLEKKIGTKPDEKNLNITFILSETPSAFFDYYDDEKDLIVIDLYDTKVGESPIDSVVEHPIKGSILENIQIDLNKDVAGLKPDLRDVVRVSFKSEFNIPYELSEEFGVISLSFDWSKKIQSDIESIGRRPIWLFTGATIFAVAASALGAWIWWPEGDPPPPCYVCDTGDPPTLPR